jgi:hypothetical protein
MQVADNTTRGNDRFYGYCIDLLKEILNHTEPFDYTIRVVEDGQFGNKDPNTNSWTGMIGELARKVLQFEIKNLIYFSIRENSKIYSFQPIIESSHCFGTNICDGRT